MKRVLKCPSGEMSKSLSVGISKKGCRLDGGSSDCKIKQKKKCEVKTKGRCRIELNTTEVLNKCSKAANETNARFFIRYKCVSKNLRTHFGDNVTIKRKTVTYITVITDIVTSLAFLMAILWIRSNVDAEVKKYKEKAVQLGDFSVEIKHLPKLAVCSDSEQLRAKLTLHIAKIVKDADIVLEKVD